MKKMTKLLSLTLALIMALSLFVLASCTKKETKDDTSETKETVAETKAETTENQPQENAEEKPESIRVAALAGPTGIGMSKLIEDNTNNTTEYKYNFTIASSPEEVKADVIKGDYDIACVPVNLAPALYKATEGKLGVVGMNTLGVLYILENGNTINSVADLKGKTIYATAQGSTPEYVLRYVLSKNNIDPDKDVTIEFLAEHAELAAKLKENQVAIGMLPEPQVTAATMGTSVRIALDLTEEWDKVSDTSLVQGVIIVNNEFADKYPKALEGFLSEYKTSVDYVNNNVEEASLLVEKAGIIPKAAIAKNAIPNCNICLVTGEEMKASVGAMLNVLFEANPKSIGGAIPDEKFYK